jgi:formamidopyrimidine-DNA glycosylase
MPELPEVETCRRAIERVLKGKRIARVEVDESDRIGYDRQSPREFGRAVEGARVVGCRRKGKYFWIELDRRPWPVLHLGMSGNVEIRRKGGAFAKAWGGPIQQSKWKKPEATAKVLPYCRLRIRAADGTEVAVTDPRRFARFRLAMDPAAEPPVSRLGFDPLFDFPSARGLAAILAKRRAPIKAVLLDQGLFAGVGNWIADEVLYQAKLSPHRLASSLAAAEVSRLRAKILDVCKRAVDVSADYRRFPRGWLFHDRWGKVKGAVTSHRRLAIRHDTVGGRTTAWVPERQR